MALQEVNKTQPDSCRQIQAWWQIAALGTTHAINVCTHVQSVFGPIQSCASFNTQILLLISLDLKLNSSWPAGCHYLVINSVLTGTREIKRMEKRYETHKNIETCWNCLLLTQSPVHAPSVSVWGQHPHHSRILLQQSRCLGWSNTTLLHAQSENERTKTKQRATKWYKSVPTAETSSESPRVVTTWNVWMSKEKQQHLLRGTSISLALAHWHATNPQAATMQNHDAGIKPPYGIFTELLGFLQLSALQEITLWTSIHPKTYRISDTVCLLQLHVYVMYT